ncbi:hypothetical protein BDK88_0380 [Natrinema hispanicum]|uniref:Uncharacterized protein n=1 Tax=Natrinema hispanicum TaxID=392421 RepID=A0A482YFC6_9EURY|nr:hypothetical protein [Natrinema hispanicum]RZV11501.1 hypothetical protein BDK88_0380 [Natrinema hispanicum]
MSLVTDGVLAVIALAAFVGGLAVASAPLLLPFVAVGVLGTLVFEAIAFSHSDLVRQYWERPTVQLGTLAGAFVIVGIGIAVAPSRLLSAGIGALVTYLLVLSVVLVTVARS